MYHNGSALSACVYASITPWSCVAPQGITNQCPLITYTPPGNHLGIHGICSTNSSMMCKSVFILTSSMSYIVTSLTNSYKTSIKLRQCVQLPVITISCAKWLNSFSWAPPKAFRLLCLVPLICLWLGIKCIRRSGLDISRTSGKTIRLFSAKIPNSRNLKKLCSLFCLGLVKLFIWAIWAILARFLLRYWLTVGVYSPTTCYLNTLIDR